MTMKRATRIMTTIGPSCDNETILRRMLQAGADAFRFNMSHGTKREHAAAMSRLRTVAETMGRSIGIMVDLQGPRLRTGPNEGGVPIPLRRGALVGLRFGGRGPGGAPSRSDSVLLPVPELAGVLKRGDRILLEDGVLVLVVEQISARTCRVRVQRGAMLREHAGVNLPGRMLPIRVPTEKDVQDIAFAVRQGADLIALSFVQSAEDVRAMKRLLPSRALSHGAGRLPLVIAKLEKPSALDHLDEIIEESDGVLVARGDMGVELSLEKVPFWQKEILRRARSRGRLTITATQMLESMVHNPVPTRAEVSDVANAILDGTDALLLTAETAAGKYPVDSVRMLATIARETDRMSMADVTGSCACGGGGWGGEGGCGDACACHDAAAGFVQMSPVDAIAHAAAELAEEVAARRILVFTWSGRTVRLLARCRSGVPIVALTPFETTRRQLSLAWNTETRILPPVHSVEEMMRQGLRLIQRDRLAKKGDTLVVLAGSGKLRAGTNLMRVVKL
jgi:pyruvate kinase